MLRYSKVQNFFWTDEKVVQWDSDTKLLGLYALTSPHNNILGCYVLPKSYILGDLGWEAKRLVKPFSKLLAERFVEYDETVSLILIPNYLRHNMIENLNQAKAAIKILHSLPKSPLLSDSLKQLVELLDKPFLEQLVEQLRKQIPKPVTGTVTGTVTRTLLSETADDSDKTVAKKEYEKEFEETLWPEIWKKETRADTLRLVTSLRKKGVSLATLLAGIREYRREKESEGKELQFYMQPKKFFGRGEHWKEYAEKAEEREGKQAVAREAEVTRQGRVRQEQESKPPPTAEEMAKAKEQAGKFKEQARQIASARSIT